MDSTAAIEVGQSSCDGTASGGDHQTISRARCRVIPAPSPHRGSRQEANGFQARAGCRNRRPIVPTLGAHSAILAVIAAITVPGDKVAFEDLTYCSAARSVNLMGRRSIILHTENGSRTPDDFERLCAQQHPKLVFLMPSLHNPTAATMPEEHRRAIVEIARRHNVWIIEDEIYGLGDGARSRQDCRSRAGADISYWRPVEIRGGGRARRLGCLPSAPRGACPTRRTRWLPAACHSSWRNSAQNSSIQAMRMRSARKVREEIVAREAIARSAFAGMEFTSQPLAPFLWMKLPDPWLSGTFKKRRAE